MTERPIIFSAPMVKAILEGRKTQTRRILKNQHPRVIPGGPVYDAGGGQMDYVESEHDFGTLPYAVGDLLWVREAWRAEARFDKMPMAVKPTGALVSYEADYDYEPNDGCRGRLRPSIHMPRWASRITLRVTEVRVQRLQDISEEDAKAEGVEPLHGGYYPYGISTFMTVMLGDREVPAQYCPTARQSFQMLWGHIHGPGAWEANPYIVALTFKRT